MSTGCSVEINIAHKIMCLNQDRHRSVKFESLIVEKNVPISAWVRAGWFEWLSRGTDARANVSYRLVQTNVKSCNWTIEDKSLQLSKYHPQASRGVKCLMLTEAEHKTK